MRAIETTVGKDMAETEAAVRDALAAQGFGVLTEIDVAAVLKAKIGVDRPPLKILGACNPTFANRALEIDPTVALALPCNVILETAPGGTRVAAVDPHEMIAGPALEDLADEAADKLRKALDSLGVS